MKSPLIALGVLASFLCASQDAHAQIIWSTAAAISGYSDISTDGTFIDAVTPHSIDTYGNTPAPSTITIGDSIFKIGASNGDSTISFADYLGDGTDGTGPDGFSHYNPGATEPSSTAEADYNEILTRCGYSGTAMTVTLNGLTSGQSYEVEIWNSTPRMTTYTSGSNSVALANQFSVGTFVAGGTSQNFSFAFTPGQSNGNDLAVVTDIELRAVPEPSTYGAMALGVLALAGAMRLRKLAA